MLIEHQSAIAVEFKVARLKPYQSGAMDDILQKKDVFVIQPTSSGKSLVYKALPFANSIVNNIHNSCILLIQPIESLMIDQMNTLSKLSIPVARLMQKQSPDMSKIANAHVIFTSPEAILLDHHNLLLDNKLVSRIMAIVVDECHMVQKWGIEGENAFRPAFGRLSELRSFLTNVPVLALTATASPLVKMQVISALGMKNPSEQTSSPDRPNIKYSVVNYPGELEEMVKHFWPVRNALVKLKENCPKVIIFVYAMKQGEEVLK